jgi:hypothetical protein
MKTRMMNRAKPTSDTQTNPTLPSHPVVEVSDVEIPGNLTHPSKVANPAREAVEEDDGLRLGGRRLVPRMDLRGSIRLHRAVHDVGGLVAACLVGAAAVLGHAPRVSDAVGDGEALDDAAEMVRLAVARADPGRKFVAQGGLGEGLDLVTTDTADKLAAMGLGDDGDVALAVGGAVRLDRSRHDDVADRLAGGCGCCSDGTGGDGRGGVVVGVLSWWDSSSWTGLTCLSAIGPFRRGCERYGKEAERPSLLYNRNNPLYNRNPF